MTPPDDVAILRIAHLIYKNMEQYPSALLVALRLNDMELINSDFAECWDPIIKKQLAYILARQQISVDTEDESLLDILSNNKLSEHFKSLGKDLGVSEPKIPEDIFKTHLESNSNSHLISGTCIINAGADSAKQNLASTFVNAFLNAGFGTDKLMMGAEEGSWIYKNKDHGNFIDNEE